MCTKRSRPCICLSAFVAAVLEVTLVVGGATNRVTQATDSQPTAPPATGAAPAGQLEGLTALRDEALRLRPLVQSDLARSFLDAAERLPPADQRRIFRDPETREYLSEKSAAALPVAVREKLTTTDVTDDLYYKTRFGSPLVYVRVLDLLAQRTELRSLAGRRVFDFGYGSIGQLRMMAELGADARGAEVFSLLWAMYEVDQGPFGNSAARGRVTIVNARWPADADAVKTIGGEFDLITSKNTLKNGYLNPERPVDKRQMVDLGVEQPAFVRALFEALKPGGFVLIYNLCPAPAPADAAYIPWADGRCPFPRSMVEMAGFKVLAFDESDDAAGRSIFEALGYPTKKPSGEDDLFVWFTLLQRPE